MQKPLRVKLSAILRLRCPRCCVRNVFYGRFAMHSNCPHCGLQFEREPGYFFGAMYFSYGIGVIMIGVFALIAYWILRLELQWCALIGWLVFLPFTPAVFRYSRVLWMHFDRTFDPGDQSEPSATGTGLSRPV